ncbi:hypothetical protein [Streptomyces sp. B1I3]|uniref:hypothetical protein n=1 Tax=Streptomyces sp. B1I3 TaxID=3042264 RepID=UPI00277F0248|nr:hypothetical protein [Streptomyces sp. B1I3]MDQ0792069.1 hypothetical protein [Streptomyces sp. B1I3]
MAGADFLALALLHAGLARMATDGRRAAVVDPGNRPGPPDLPRERTGRDLPRERTGRDLPRERTGRDLLRERTGRDLLRSAPARRPWSAARRPLTGPDPAPTRWPPPTSGGR